MIEKEVILIDESMKLGWKLDELWANENNSIRWERLKTIREKVWKRAKRRNEKFNKFADKTADTNKLITDVESLLQELKAKK